MNIPLEITIPDRRVGEPDATEAQLIELSERIPELKARFIGMWQAESVINSRKAVKQASDTAIAFCTKAMKELQAEIKTQLNDPEFSRKIQELSRPPSPSLVPFLIGAALGVSLS